ncbi:MAG: CBS domain-containing protein [Candidatus Dadabacteria bacterium]|nr:CBS domain-containing protein [Candidatus Dadabacteria bacterium]
MAKNVIGCQPHHTVEHVKKMMKKNKVHAIPVLDGENELRGIVSSMDMTEDLKNKTPISKVMTEKVYTIPMYNDIHHVARLMRNHKVHHVVVTHEKKIVGILSSFDLLKLVEDHRFVMKPAPSKSTKKQTKRL